MNILIRYLYLSNSENHGIYLKCDKPKNVILKRHVSFEEQNKNKTLNWLVLIKRPFSHLYKIIHSDYSVLFYPRSLDPADGWSNQSDPVRAHADVNFAESLRRQFMDHTL